MAEITGKRKARDMNNSNSSDYDEPDQKLKKSNENNRRRSSFIRGKNAFFFRQIVNDNKTKPNFYIP